MKICQNKAQVTDGLYGLHRRWFCSLLGTSHVFWYFLGQFLLKVVFFRVSKIHGLVFLGYFFRFSDGHPYPFYHEVPPGLLTVLVLTHRLSDNAQRPRVPIWAQKVFVTASWLHK